MNILLKDYLKLLSSITVCIYFISAIIFLTYSHATAITDHTICSNVTQSHLRLLRPRRNLFEELLQQLQIMANTSMFHFIDISHDDILSQSSSSSSSYYPMNVSITKKYDYSICQECLSHLGCIYCDGETSDDFGRCTMAPFWKKSSTCSSPNRIRYFLCSMTVEQLWYYMTVMYICLFGIVLSIWFVLKTYGNVCKFIMKRYRYFRYQIETNRRNRLEEIEYEKI
ncbi:hypothetical protein SNEBB_010759 [Seison nebaliae]|nr:hypothetical protein SNEBB_010759 [Seison nebaliae]